MMPSTHRLSLERIEQAAKIVDPVFLNSPQFECETLSEELGTRLALKIETLNPIRPLNERGADFLLSQIKDDKQLICASAGNFGQAIAYACRKRAVNLIVYASTRANPLKVERMRSLGATVILHGEDFDAAKHAAKRVALEQNYQFIEDSRDVETAEGAGTIGLEWLNFPHPLDALLIPLGNGAMLNGIARVMKVRSPKTRIIAIQAAGAPAMVES